MKRFAMAALVVCALVMGASDEARAQGFGIGFGGFGPGYGGFGPGFGYGSGIGMSVGPSLGYSRAGYGGYGGYGYRPSYGGGYDGYSGVNRNVYSYGRVSPSYSVRRPAYTNYGRVTARRCH